MINLNVNDYCHNCPEFEPKVDKLYAFNETATTFIYCEHKELCDRIHDYLLRTNEEQGNVEEENKKTK